MVNSVNHEIDLKKYDIRSDLVLDSIENNKSNIESNVYEKNEIKVTKVNINKDNSGVINKKEGKYITIEFDDVTDSCNRDKVKEIFTDELKGMINGLNLDKDYTAIVIGLGNEKSTPDSLGPKVINNTLITRYLYVLGEKVSNGIRCVSGISPGVMADTGIETVDIIFSLVNKIRPDIVIVVDALAASSISRINKSIQITDSGIHPGSGVGNMRKEISFDTLGIPVIAIGVPTVVSSSIIVYDTLEFLFKHISYIKDNQNKNKLIFGRKNYLNKIVNRNLSNKEKISLMGIIGSLSEDEEKDLINEVLDSLSYNFIVTPKEIDFLIDKLAEVISSGINNALHKINVK